ncbi:MAG: outer membrane protein assembly factor BamD [Parvularculaceae bacterium]
MNALPFPFRAIALIAALLAVAACSGDQREKFAFVEQPAATLYNDAADALERRRFDTAIQLFEEVERQHPFSPWSRQAQLMMAFAQYEQSEYEDAIATLDQFIALHPGNEAVPYAHYLKAMSHYVRIRDVGRDQNITNNAVQALLDVTRRYPQTEYARDARLKLDLTYDHLAGKEMYVGRYYLRAGKYIAAINRFKFVVDNYETTNHAPEALHRMVESYLRIGLADEARRAAAVLGHNYPGSDWYEFSYDLLAKNELLEAGSQPKPNQDAVRRKKKLAKKGKKGDEEELRVPPEPGVGATSPVTDDQDIGNNNPVPTNRPDLP